MRKKFLFYFIFCLSLNLFSFHIKAEDLREIIKNSPQALNYPQEDSVVIREIKKIELLSDGRVKKYVQIIRKFFTDYAVRTEDLCNPRIAFNSKTQKIEIITARTYMSDMTEVNTQENGKILASPFSLEKAPDYLTIQEMVITHVGIERGAVTVLEYIIEDLVSNANIFEGEETFFRSEPVLEKVLIIVVPKGTDLKFQILGKGSEKILPLQDLQKQKLRNKINISSDELSSNYVWEAKNLPSINFSEALNREELRYYATLYWSTAKDWSTLFKNFNTAFKANASPSQIIQKKTEEIIKGKTSLLSKINSIHEFVAKKLNTINWEWNEIQMPMRSAEDVLLSGYGHQLDKAILLFAMLDFLKVKVEFLLFSFYPNIPFALPLFSPFNKFFISVKTEDGFEFVLDPAISHSEDKRFSIPSSVKISPMRETIIPEIFLTEKQEIEIKGEIVVKNKEKIEGNFSFLLEGRFNPFFTATKSEKDFNLFIENFIREIFKGAKIEEKNIISINSQKLNFNIKFEFSPESQKNIYFFNISKINLLSKNLSPFIKRFKRQTPLNIISPLSESIFIKIKFENGLKTRIKPFKENLSSEIGDLETKAEVFENTILLQRKININQSQIMPEQYETFRSFILSPFCQFFLIVFS